VFLLHEANYANRLSSHGDLSSIICHLVALSPRDVQRASKKQGNKRKFITIK
jgi:hypothetical protein